MKENQFNIFSVPIWGFIFNDHKYQSENYLERILEIEQTEPSERKSNFGGFQTRDNLHKEPVLREFVSMLNKVSNDIMKEQNGAEVEVKEMWANINHEYNHNGAHIHSGILSGVFYLKTPPNSGKLVLVNPAVRADGKFLRASNFGINPEPLACIIFPSWLEHYVEPNLSNDLRVSISFNVDVK